MNFYIKCNQVFGASILVTNTALINLIDKWLRSVDEGEVVGAIFFDLKKAFDILLKKYTIILITFL